MSDKCQRTSGKVILMGRYGPILVRIHSIFSKRNVIFGKFVGNFQLCKLTFIPNLYKKTQAKIKTLDIILYYHDLHNQLHDYEQTCLSGNHIMDNESITTIGTVRGTKEHILMMLLRGF